MDELRALNQPRATAGPSYLLNRVGDAWTVGPAGTGTRQAVSDLSKVPEAILALDAALARAEHITAVAA